MGRVVGTDPGTSSLDLLLLDGGRVDRQHRFAPGSLRDDPDALGRLLRSWSPIDLIAGPSGYGLPLVRGEDLTEVEVDLMALTRPDERGQAAGVIGFRGWVRAFLGCGVPMIFLPGGIHLPTIPAHRKLNALDMGTADKVAVAAMAVRHDDGSSPAFAVVEVGSAFTAVLVVQGGRIVDASAGSRGPLGLRSGGSWDGEAAYWLSPLGKADLFRGGWADAGDLARPAFVDSLRRAVGGLQAVTSFERIYLSGAGLDRPEVLEATGRALDGLGEPVRLPDLPGAWVKHAAQGSALLADGLSGGANAPLIEALALRRSSGTILDHLRHRRPMEAPP